jgi:hypothetical protein
MRQREINNLGWAWQADFANLCHQDGAGAVFEAEPRAYSTENEWDSQWWRRQDGDFGRLKGWGLRKDRWCFVAAP